jgi:hypothetical protein
LFLGLLATPIPDVGGQSGLLKTFRDDSNGARLVCGSRLVKAKPMNRNRSHRCRNDRHPQPVPRPSLATVLVSPPSLSAPLVRGPVLSSLSFILPALRSSERRRVGFAKFRLLGRNSGFLGLFQGRKNFPAVNHKSPLNQSALPSSICYLLSPNLAPAPIKVHPSKSNQIQSNPSKSNQNIFLRARRASHRPTRNRSLTS